MPEVCDRNIKSLVIKDKNIFSITLVSLVYLVSWALVSPYITIRIHEIAGNFFLTGLLISVYYLIRLFFDIPISRFCEKRNTKKVIQMFFLIATLVSLSYIMVNNITQLTILRILHGFVAAGLWISFWTYTREIKAKKKLAEVPAEVLLIDYLSDFVLVVGPLVGAFIMFYYSWTYGFILVSLGMLVGFFLTVKKVKPIENQVKTLQPFKEEFSNFSLYKKVSTLPLLIVVFFGLGSIFWVFLPIILFQAGFSLVFIGITLAFMYVSGLLMEENARDYANRFGCRNTLLVSVLLQAFSFWMLSKTFFPPVVFLSALIVGTAWLFFKQGANRYFQKILNLKTRDAVDGSLRIFLELGAVIVLPLFGYALNFVEVGGLLYLFSILTILSIIFIWPLKTGKTSNSKYF